MRDLLYSLIDKTVPLGPRGDAALLDKIFEALEIRKRGGLALLDIGAAGDITPRFAPVERHIAYIGFEPDERSRVDLLAKDHNYVSYTIREEALGANFEEITLNLCRGPVFSSPFPPNRAILDRYPGSEVFDVVQEFRMKAAPLDSVGLPRCDFIKVDIQGGELAALRGGQKTLANCFGMEVELELMPLYSGQPLFRDVQQFAEENGFEFIDFITLGRWSRDRKDRLGQTLYGDGLFLRTPEQVAANFSEDIDIAAYLGVLMVYRRHDLARTLLKLLPASHWANKGRFPALLKAADRRQMRIASTHRAAFRLIAGDTPGYRAHLFY